MPGLVDLLDERTAWMADGACVEADPDLWFSIDWQDRRRALELCASCDVQVDCLAYAITNRETEGIWGGKTEAELIEIYRAAYRRTG